MALSYIGITFCRLHEPPEHLKGKHIAVPPDYMRPPQGNRSAAWPWALWIPTPTADLPHPGTGFVGRVCFVLGSCIVGWAVCWGTIQSKNNLTILQKHRIYGFINDGLNHLLQFDISFLRSFFVFFSCTPPPAAAQLATVALAPCSLTLSLQSTCTLPVSNTFRNCSTLPWRAAKCSCWSEGVSFCNKTHRVSRPGHEEAEASKARDGPLRDASAGTDQINVDGFEPHSC